MNVYAALWVNAEGPSSRVIGVYLSAERAMMACAREERTIREQSDIELDWRPDDPNSWSAESGEWSFYVVTREDMDIRCDDCKWWVPNGFRDGIANWGWCKRTAVCAGDPRDKESKASVIVDGDGELGTTHTFGCVQWESECDSER